MRIALLSPYHGGSHQAWAEGYQAHSRHEVVLLTMPARFWKWRMHGGALVLAEQFRKLPALPDRLLATDMLDLTTFLALTRRQSAGIPAVLYMHENQMTYPLPSAPGTGPMRRQMGERDLHYAFINYASALAADRIAFNSQFHRSSFLSALPAFLGRFPEFNVLHTVGPIEERSAVLPVGVDLERLEGQGLAPEGQQPPLILWNQRWEYDKNPAAFFQALYQLQEEGLPFRLALCGQNFRRRPAEFEEAVARLGSRLVHAGFATPQRYRQLLHAADITVSTAHHEFFGISLVEAIACRTFPILPRRLSYPEIIPEQWHGPCLYADEEGLRQRLRWALEERERAREIAGILAGTMARYDWRQLAPVYDRFLEQ